MRYYSTGIHTGSGDLRVAEEDHEAMKIGPWVARKRKAFWEARFAVAVANCNASMISITGGSLPWSKFEAPV